MNPASIVLLSLAMSTDAFAAAVGKGTALKNPRFREALRTGVIFGVIEALTPLVGWLLGTIAASYAADYDHWIAFVLLCGIGLMMLKEGGSHAQDPTASVKVDGRKNSFWILALTGLATSIDALAVGVGLAFVEVSILWVALSIGFSTFVLVTLGVMVGRWVGKVVGKRAEILGGLLLIGIGCGILYEHLNEF